MEIKTEQGRETVIKRPDRSTLEAGGGRGTALVSFPSLRSQGGVVAFSIPLRTRLCIRTAMTRSAVVRDADARDVRTTRPSCSGIGQ